MRSRSSSLLTMRRSVVVMAALLLGCSPCERLPRRFAMASESRSIPASIDVGTNAVRVRCRFDVNAPGHDDLVVVANWYTQPLFDTSVAATIHATSSFAQDYSLSKTWNTSGSVGGEQFTISFVPEISPCDEQCAFNFEVTVQIVSIPNLGTGLIAGTFYVAVDASKTAVSSGAAGSITLDCDPVEHLDLP